MITNHLTILCALTFGLTLVLSHSYAHLQPCNQLHANELLTQQNDVLSNVPLCAKPVLSLAEGQLLSGISSGPRNPATRLLPPWFNATAFRRGQEFATKHLLAQVVGTIFALSIFSGVPDIKSVVFHTNNANSPQQANRRHLATFLQVKVWLEDLAPPGHEISPRIVKSWQRIRDIHSEVADRFKGKAPLHAAQAPNLTRFKVDTDFWDALAQDLHTSKIPTQFRDWPNGMRHVYAQNSSAVVAMNQLGMSTIQWAFFGVQFIRPELCGIYGASDSEWGDYFHLWAVISYAMGMDDEYNIALQPNLATARAYFWSMYNTYFIPSMFQFDDEGKILWECFFKGPADLFLGPTPGTYFKKEQVMIWTLEAFMGVSATALRAKLRRDGVTLSTGLEALLPLTRMTVGRSAAVWAINALFLKPNGRRVFGVDSFNITQVVELAYT